MLDHVERATPRTARGPRAATRAARAVRRRFALLLASVGALYDLLPLYFGVLLVNGLLVLVAVLLIALTPFTIAWPIAQEQAIVLVAGAVAVLAVDAVLLRAGLRPLLQVLAAMRSLDLLGGRQHLPEIGCAEVRSLTRTFNEMFERLDQERRRSAHRVLAALEGERRRVGQELHDEIGQRLTGILLELSPAIAAAPPELRPRLVALQESTRATLAEVGQLAWQLRPGILDDLGLAAALDALLTGAADHSSVDVRRRLPEQPLALAPEIELAVYRIAQEALTNALRHADADTVVVSLERTRGGLVLNVSDDGVGLAPGASEGPGLQGMRERAHLLDGSLEVVPRGSLGGVSVRLWLPLQDGPA